MILKKHHTFFEQSEIDCLNSFRQNLELKGFTKHAVDRYHEKGIYHYWNIGEFEDVVKDIRNSFVVEVKYITQTGGHEERYTIRSKESRNGFNLVVVVNKEGLCVTCWLNKADDTHSTLKKEQYTNNLHIH